MQDPGEAIVVVEEPLDDLAASAERGGAARYGENCRARERHERGAIKNGESGDPAAELFPRVIDEAEKAITLGEAVQRFEAVAVAREDQERPVARRAHARGRYGRLGNPAGPAGDQDLADSIAHLAALLIRQLGENGQRQNLARRLFRVRERADRVTQVGVGGEQVDRRRVMDPGVDAPLQQGAAHMCRAARSGSHTHGRRDAHTASRWERHTASAR